ncbi:MAG: HAD family phosphatase [Phreatobacter sp.]|uniref:HAD family hydrolase n=1 Tax=Phreatobacter sp. TaxID=1966341 RepID=UPI0027345CD1|nr:HAD family phosphatase [Phreatobacter sp.]MDP2802154.1 HAD family phosphatase [Phreatobacter sp.]
MIRAIAWDIDGTLVDSEPRHHRALLVASRALGVALDDLPDQAFRGVHMLDVWEVLRSRYPSDVGRDPWLDAINRAYVADAEPLTPIAGGVDVIRSLHGAGLTQVCVSNSNRVVVDANIVALGLAPYLVGSISLDDVACGKPDPEPYRIACAMLGLPPHEVAAVEDSATGAVSARAAGLLVIGFGPALGHGEADLICGSLLEIPRLLQEAVADRPAGPQRAVRPGSGG